MTALNCPNCGHTVDLRFQNARMTTCASCETSLFLDGEQFRAAGTQGIMHTGPMLIEQGDIVLLEGLPFDVVGHARFDYGPGWWDEFWALEQSGEGAWISVDEGEVILQRALSGIMIPSIKTAPALGTTVKAGNSTYHVTEADTATCVAVVGDLPEVLRVGERYKFVNCLNDDGALLSGEFADGQVDWYSGTYIDPFDVEKLVVS